MAALGPLVKAAAAKKDKSPDLAVGAFVFLGYFGAMKKALPIAAALALILLLTNPGIRVHRIAVGERLYNDFYLDNSNPNKMDVSPYARLTADSKAAEGVIRKNWGIFSLTEWNLIINGHNYGHKVIGIGFLGQVYLWGSFSL